MNPYQLLFGPLWPTAPKHEQFPGRNPELVPALQGLHRCGYIHSTETVQGRAAWFIAEKGNDYIKK